MITPAIFEDMMNDHKDRLNTKLSSKDIQMKAVKDVVDVLKQFGYDSGASAFVEIMENKMEETR